MQVRGTPRGSIIQGSDREMPTLGNKGIRKACLPWHEEVLSKHSEVGAQGKGILERSVSEASTGGQRGDSEEL